jgi:uncharacterized protein (TIGR03086 family)
MTQLDVKKGDAMSEQDTFILADEALSQVVSQIRDDQWGMKLPAWFQVGRTQDDPSLRDIINYHAYDDAWVPDVLAGRAIAEVGSTHDGDLLGADPKASFARIVATAVTAVRTLDNPDKTVHLSYGDFPAREYLQHITYFRGLRVHDIAKLIGIDTTMSAELVQALWEMLVPQVEQWRAMRVFGPAVAVPAHAPLQDRLLGLTGRQP